MMSSAPPLLCLTCLHVSPAPVSLPCGHAFCLTCLRTMDRGVDRHSCPQCRREYHPDYYKYQDYSQDCAQYCDQYCNGYYNEYCEGLSQSNAQNMSNIQTNVEAVGGEMDERGRDQAFQNKTPLFDLNETNQNMKELTKTETANLSQNMSPFKIKYHQNAQEEVEGKGVADFQNKTPLFDLNDGVGNWQNLRTSQNLSQNLSPFKIKYHQNAQEEVERKGVTSFQNKTPLPDPNDSLENSESQARTNQNIEELTDIKVTNLSQNESEVQRNADLKELDERGGSQAFQSKTPLFDVDDSVEKCEKQTGTNRNAANFSQNMSPFKIKYHQNAQEEVEGKAVAGFQSKTPLVSVLGSVELEKRGPNAAETETSQVLYLDVKGICRFQNKTSLSGQKEAEIKSGNEIFQSKSSRLAVSGADDVKLNHAAAEMKSLGFQNKTGNGYGSFKINQHNLAAAAAVVGEMKAAAGFEQKGSAEFQNKSPAAIDSELYHYLKSKMSPNFTGNDLERGEFQNKTPLLPVFSPDLQTQNSSSGNKQEMIIDNEMMEEFQNKTTHMKENEFMDLENLAFQNKSPISEEDERKMAESKVKLTSRVADLTKKLEKAEMVLQKERDDELTATAANAKLRQNALTLVQEVSGFAQRYSDTIMRRIERELHPGEEILRQKVENASGVSSQLKKTIQRVERLLRERDADVFMSEVERLETEVEKCSETKLQEESEELKFDLSKLCPDLERLNREFQDKLGEVQRSLRGHFNPSEVTFDPETLHPNLLLSEDLKTVTFTAKRQSYESSEKRFSNFIQALSSQCFRSGTHRFEVELDGAPWMVGVCVASSVPRSGLSSALETSPLSWTLMWNQNLLTAFEGGRATALHKTAQVSRRLELRLDCDSGQLDFYFLSETSGRRHLHRCQTETREPLHLAYRMLCGDARGRVTLHC